MYVPLSTRLLVFWGTPEYKGDGSPRCQYSYIWREITTNTAFPPFFPFTGERVLCFHGPLLYEAKVQNPFSFKKLVETTGLIIRFQWWVALVRATFFVDFQVHSSSSLLSLSHCLLSGSHKASCHSCFPSAKGK